MKRHLLLLLIFAWFLACADTDAASLRNSRPNIILIMTDDQGIGDIGALGNPIIQTPNTDRLHGLSTRFTDFHVSPTCAPTRSAIMTGRHEFQNGVTHTILERERMTLKASTLPQALRQAGYATGIFGKWHLGDEADHQPQNRGFSEVFIHGAGGIGQAYDCSCADFPPNQQNKYFDNVISHNGTPVQTQGYCTDVFFKAALGWIRSRQEAGEPFFAYITPNAPHGPMIAPASYTKRFEELGFDKNSAGRMGMIENIDDNLGLMLAKLQEWGLEEKTLLIFMTDNGQAGRSGKQNGKNISLDFSGFKTGKGSPYEGGTHVPAFWRWKGTLPEGRDIPALAAHIDLFPTFAELTGAQLPLGSQVRGVSLLPLLEDPKASWPHRLLFVHKGRWPKGAEPNEYQWKDFAVRGPRFRWVNGKELYDIQKDPFEKQNVIEQHPDVVQTMKAAYEAWWKETRPLMVNEDAPNSPTRPMWELYEKATTGGRALPVWKEPAL